MINAWNLTKRYSGNVDKYDTENKEILNTNTKYFVEISIHAVSRQLRKLSLS